MDIANIFCQGLGVTSHAKTFLMVCRFRTDLVSVWTARGIRSKKIVIRSNGLGYPFEKLVIRSNGSGYPFEKNLSTVWATEAIFSKINFSRVSIPKPFRRWPLASNDLFLQVTYRYEVFIFYAFVVYEPRNETSFSLHVENTKHEKYIFFNWLHFFFSRLFLYHKEVSGADLCRFGAGLFTFC